MVKRFCLGVAAAMTLFTAQAASAATTFDFTAPPTGSSGGSNNGNSLSWTVGGITVTATAWSMNTAFSSTPDTAKLFQYDYGLGVTDRQAGDGNSPYHTIDNVGLYDFVVLTFSRPVQILTGSLTPFDVSDNHKNDADNDAWVSFTNTTGNTPITDPTVWANLNLAYNGGGHATEVLGNLNLGNNPNSKLDDYLTNLNPGMNTGNVWIIGADKFNANDLDDGFKLTGLTVQLPVPEPAAWAMMVVGFGLVGGTLRRRGTKPMTARLTA